MVALQLTSANSSQLLNSFFWDTDRANMRNVYSTMLGWSNNLVAYRGWEAKFG
jgi:hypothetical protein